MKNLYLPVFACIIYSLFCNNTLKANNYYFNGSGNWSDNSKWSPHYPGTTITTTDTFFITAASTCITDSVIRVAGVLENKGTLTVSFLIKIINQGKLVNAANAVLINSASVRNDGIIINNGLWTGTGLIQNDFTNDGVLRSENNATNTPAISNIDGNYAQNANASYAVKIYGIDGAGATNGNSQLAITGSAFLSGMVDIQLGNGFVPSLADSFSIMTYNNQSGTLLFNYPSLPPGLSWQEIINANDIIITVISSPLPVELINFKLNRTNNKILLNWQTATESNTLGFGIERKTNSHWTNIGFLNGAGNSSSIRSYSFTDNTPANGINYYRLRQVDINGRITYSDIKAIRLEKEGIQKITIYPNPATDAVNLLTEEIETKEAAYTIIDVKGNVVHQGKINKQSAATPVKVNISNLAKGIYLIRYSDGGQQQCYQLIIQ